MQVDRRIYYGPNNPVGPRLTKWNTKRFNFICKHLHMINSVQKSTTHNNIYEWYLNERVMILIETRFVNYNCLHMVSGERERHLTRQKRKMLTASTWIYREWVSIWILWCNEIYYTAWFLLVILKHSCSKLHCIEVFELKLFLYEICHDHLLAEVPSLLLYYFQA